MCWAIAAPSNTGTLSAIFGLESASLADVQATMTSSEENARRRRTMDTSEDVSERRTIRGSVAGTTVPTISPGLTRALSLLSDSDNRNTLLEIPTGSAMGVRRIRKSRQRTGAP